MESFSEATGKFAKFWKGIGKFCLSAGKILESFAANHSERRRRKIFFGQRRRKPSRKAHPAPRSKGETHTTLTISNLRHRPTPRRTQSTANLPLISCGHRGQRGHPFLRPRKSLQRLQLFITTLYTNNYKYISSLLSISYLFLS